MATILDFVISGHCREVPLSAVSTVLFLYNNCKLIFVVPNAFRS